MPPNLPPSDDTTRATSGRVLPRALAGRATGIAALPLLLDACTQDGRAHVTFGNGVAADALLPDGAPGCALPLELRGV